MSHTCEYVCGKRRSGAPIRCGKPAEPCMVCRKRLCDEHWDHEHEVRNVNLKKGVIGISYTDGIEIEIEDDFTLYDGIEDLDDLKRLRAIVDRCIRYREGGG